MANEQSQTNGQSKVVPPQGGPIPRTADTAKATQVVDGGERMPLKETAEAKSERQAESQKPKAKVVISTADDFTRRVGILMQDDNGNWGLVCIEPVEKPKLGKVSVVDKKGETIPPKANFNMSGFGRISIDLQKDRKARIDAETVGKTPMLYSPPSIYSPATQYEIANANKTSGMTEAASNERESIDF